MDSSIQMILAIGAIALYFLLVKKLRDKKFSKDCPKCKHPNVSPKPTGLKYRGGCPCYDYKCPNCGYKFSN